jgi:hypothetical protein
VTRRLGSLAAVGVALAAGFVAGCSITLDDLNQVEATHNECTASSECGGGTCVDGACMANAGSFSTVLFEMTPPASASEIAGVRFIEQLDGLSWPSIVSRVDLAFGHVAQVTGTVLTDPTTPADNCSVRMTLVPREGLLGLPTVDYGLDATTTANGNFTFSLRVPPGDYSAYVQPTTVDTAGAACAIPPQLYRSVTVAPGDVMLDLTLPPPERLALTVLWPDTIHSLDGWTVDLLDPVSGRQLSTQSALSSADLDLTTTPPQYTTAIYYSPVADVTPSTGKELVRLSPPEGVSAPTFLMERAALELFVKGEGIINQLTMLPEVIDVEGQVVLSDNTQPAKASITLAATTVYDVNAGVRASYVRTVEADSDGRFSVQLLPGEYDVYTVPSADTGLAAATTTLVVSRGTSPQAGKAIELLDAAVISGAVSDPGERRPIQGVQVQAVPVSVAQPLALYDRSLGPVSFVPRASATTVDDDGRFSVLADPGTFDVSIRPPAETRFAWLVRPNVSVAQPGKDLGPVRLPLPVRYHGAVTTAATGLVPGALIRAYIFMDQTPSYTADPSLARSVLQIAETTSDDWGEFDLYLPSQIN